ncbi:hypothetical protein P8452_71562 [Trifolium repens]|nr:hypothetical protein P8452_71562 [Trifolium repens]
MILLFLKGNKNKGVYLSIYLEAVKTANMSEGWSRDVKVKFVLFNKRNTNMTMTKDLVKGRKSFPALAKRFS